jgi:hypothetical protein
MRLLINGREARGPGAYVIGTLAVLLVLAVLVFVVLPILGIVAVVAAGSAVVYLAARALGLAGRRPGGTLRSDESEYRIESSRQLGNDDRTLP